jgi:hypothetical protein
MRMRANPKEWAYQKHTAVMVLRKYEVVGTADHFLRRLDGEDVHRISSDRRHCWQRASPSPPRLAAQRPMGGVEVE